MTTTYFYDGRGHATAVLSPTGLLTQTLYDGLGRVYYSSVGASATNLATETTTHYNVDGTVDTVTTVNYGTDSRRQTTVTKNSHDAGTGQLQTTTVNGVAMASYHYNVGGLVDMVTDANGVKTRSEYDNLGRVTRKVEAYVDGAASPNDDRITQYQYTGLDQVHLISVWNAKPGATTSEQQDTRYEYGSDYGNNDLLATIHYPAGADPVSGSEVIKYNALSEVTWKRDRTGVEHTYMLDGMGRVLADSVALSSLSPQTDSKVLWLAYSYDALGDVTLATSGGASGVVNQVQRQYNGLGQLEWEGQYHGVTGGTTTYQYENGTGRLTGMIYPNGRTLTYNASGLDAALNRPTSIQDTDSTTLESYKYLGVDTITNRDRPASGQPDEYVSWNSLGQITSMAWANGSTAAVQYTYGYTAAGQLQWKNNQVNGQFGERFDYKSGKEDAIQFGAEKRTRFNSAK